MALRAARILSLCSGVGGLDLGVQLALPAARAVGYIEREAYAAAALVARMEEQVLHSAPIWDDLATFDPEPWRGAVDCVVGGFPCPPVSVAGRRKGTDDERWLWPEVWRITRGVGAEFLFLENVRGLVSANDGGAFRAILGDLAAARWNAEWLCLSASEVGAAHERSRWFLLAHAPDPDRRGRGDGSEGETRERVGGPTVGYGDVAHARRAERGSDQCAWDFGDGHDPGREEAADRPGGGGAELDVTLLADASSVGSRPQRARRSDLRPAATTAVGASGRELGDPERQSLALGGGERSHAGTECAPAVGAGAPFLFAPGQDDPRWGDILRDYYHLRPALSRDEETAQRRLRRMADGLGHRVERIRAVGNGVVPLQAAVALRVLAHRLGVW